MAAKKKAIKKNPAHKPPLYGYGTKTYKISMTLSLKKNDRDWLKSQKNMNDVLRKGLQYIRTIKGQADKALEG